MYRNLLSPIGRKKMKKGLKDFQKVAGKLRLSFYIQMLEASRRALDRVWRGCFVCGLLPEEGTKDVWGGCPKCRKS